MKKLIIIYSIFIVFIGLQMYSCKHKLPDANEMPEVCFTSEVLPVFQSSCGTSGCHGGGSSEGGYVFTSYNSIMEAIAPGDLNGSKAYQSIIAKWFNAMPPDNPISKDARTSIRIWIEQGARNTTCDDIIPPDTTVIDTMACFSRDILPILASSCAITDCHDNITQKEDVNLSSYANLISSEVVVTGSPTSSKLYQVLIKTGEERMPPSPMSSLTIEQINMIYKWIKEGATDNVCVSSCDTTIFTYSEAIDPIIVNNCKGCHSGLNPQKGVSLTTYAEVKAIADDGRLSDVIRALNGRPLMPPSGSLSDCKLKQIDKWIESGSPNN